MVIFIKELGFVSVGIVLPLLVKVKREQLVVA